MKIQVEGPGSISLETKNDNTLEIDTKDTNVITIKGERGMLRLYDRNGEFEVAREGRVVWSSYHPDENDAWKDWGPSPPDTKKSK